MNLSGSLITGQELKRKSLGFFAASVRIDNLTGQWLYIPQLDTYIPPYVMQWTQSFPSKTQVADILIETPPTQIANPQANQVVSYQFTEQVLPSFAGIFIQTTYLSQSFSLIAGLGSVTNLTFIARSVVINNLTGQWYYLVELDSYIPPYTNQWTGQFPAGSSTITLTATTPASQFSNPIAGEFLSGRATEEILPSFSGVFTRGRYQNTIVTAPAGSPIAAGLLFIARSVTIDNPTGQWYLETVTGRYVAPYTLGAVISFAGGTTTASITATNPSGASSQPLANQTVQANYTDEVIPDAAGNPGNSLISPGAQELPSYTLSFISPGTLANLMTIQNPLGSGYIVKFRDIHAAVYWDIDTAVPNTGEYVSGGFGRVLGAVATIGGTAATPLAHDSTDPASITVCRFQPAGFTTLVIPVLYGSFGSNYAMSSFVSEAEALQMSLYKYEPGQQAKPFVLNPGEWASFLLFGPPMAPTAFVAGNISWTEELEP